MLSSNAPSSATSMSSSPLSTTARLVRLLIIHRGLGSSDEDASPEERMERVVFVLPPLAFASVDKGGNSTFTPSQSFSHGQQPQSSPASPSPIPSQQHHQQPQQSVLSMLETVEALIDFSALASGSDSGAEFLGPASAFSPSSFASRAIVVTLKTVEFDILSCSPCQTPLFEKDTK